MAWNNQDAASLSRFVKGNSNFIAELKSRLPAIKTDGTMEQGAMSGARNAGACDIIRAIEEMQDSQDAGDRADYIDPSKD